MKRHFNIFVSSLILGLIFVSCDNWEPVFTSDYGTPGADKIVEMTPNTTIADLKALYTTEGEPVSITKNLLIGGQVISEDKSGNIYKSLYLQDATGAIEVKIGKNALYNDYKLGQWVYVNCSGLTLGSYNGMVQIGCEDASGAYETSYLEAQYLIDTHVFRGPMAEPVKPVELTESQLRDKKYHGCYVTLKGLKYGCNPDRYTSATEKIFCLVYIDYKKDTKDNANRLFLSDETYGVTTYAMSKPGFINYLKQGNFDKAIEEKAKEINTDASDLKATILKNASAYSVSHYFLMGSTDIQLRTSGYARFSDTQIDPKVISKESSVDFTGILTLYKSDLQFTLIDISGVQTNS